MSDHTCLGVASRASPSQVQSHSHFVMLHLARVPTRSQKSRKRKRSSPSPCCPGRVGVTSEGVTDRPGRGPAPQRWSQRREWDTEQTLTRHLPSGS